MSDILLHEVKDKTEIITFNNPEKLNVLSDQMLELLTKALEKASRNSETKVVIIKSTGKAFCAGHDLKQMQKARNSKRMVGLKCAQSCHHPPSAAWASGPRHGLRTG